MAEGPTGGNIDERMIQFTERCAAEKFQRTFDVRAKNFHCAGHADSTSGTESIAVGASNKDSACSDADCFDDIASAADAAVDEDFDLVTNCRDHFRQSSHCRRAC